MNQRSDQVATVMQRALQEILSRGLHDPRVRGLISILSVELAPDFSQATVRVSVVPEEHAALSIKGLRAAGRHLRSELAKKVAMRRVPRLEFVLDDSLKRAARVHKAIAETHDDDDLTSPSQDSRGEDT
ncbi:MAG: 30S ribosome-binding factor RbfA [Planctomycetota bacterium]